MKKRRCKHCMKNISHRHSNAKFCDKKCKNTHWNKKRQCERVINHLQTYYELEEVMYLTEVGWDAHKDTW